MCRLSISSTYLFAHYNLLQVLASVNLLRHTSLAVAVWRQFRIPSVFRFSSTCLAQRWGGRPCLRQPPPGSDSKTLRTGLELSIRATWPSHRRSCILIRFTTSMSSYISYSSWFHRMRYSPLSQKGPWSEVIKISSGYKNLSHISVLVYALHILEKRPRPCSISGVCSKIIYNNIII